MSFPVDITLATPPEGTCPATFDEAVDIIESLITAQVTTSYTPYVMGADTPAVEDQGKAWIRKDQSGRPLGTFIFYSGAWRRQYNGKFGQLVYFSGNPATYFDSTGKGLTTGEWDGWYIANGQNGTADLSDKFVVTAHMNNAAGQTGYSSGWRTFVRGVIETTGGAATHTIVAQDLPELDLDIDGKDYNSGGSPHVDPAVIADLLYSNSPTRTVNQGHYGYDSSTQSQTSVPTLPPYFALAMCVFLGYD